MNKMLVCALLLLFVVSTMAVAKKGCNYCADDKGTWLNGACKEKMMKKCCVDPDYEWNKKTKTCNQKTEPPVDPIEPPTIEPDEHGLLLCGTEEIAYNGKTFRYTSLQQGQALYPLEQYLTGKTFLNQSIIAIDDVIPYEGGWYIGIGILLDYSNNPTQGWPQITFCGYS